MARILPPESMSPACGSSEMANGCANSARKPGPDSAPFDNPLEDRTYRGSFFGAAASERRFQSLTVITRSAQASASLGRVLLLGGRRRLLLGQGLIHALLEIASVVVHKPAVGGLDLHLTGVPLNVQHYGVDTLPAECPTNDERSGHLGVVDPQDPVLSRVAQGILHCGPQRGAWHRIHVLVCLSKRRPGDDQRH